MSVEVIPADQHLTDAPGQQLMSIDSGVVDDGLAVDRAPEFVLEVELVGGEIEVLAAGQDVPAVGFDRDTVAEHRSDQQCPPEMVLDDPRGHSALPARRTAR